MAADNKSSDDESHDPGAGPGPAADDDQDVNGAARADGTLVKTRATAVTGILVLAILYTAYFTSTILIPMALAFLLSLMLAPVVGLLTKKLHIPPMVGAAIVIVAVLIGFGAGIYGLSTPAAHWVKEAPRVVHKLERLTHAVSGQLQEIQKVTKNVANTLPTSASESHPSRLVEIVSQTPGVFTRVMSLAPKILTGVGITVVLLYFLLAAGDSFMRSLAHAVPHWAAKKHAVETARKIQYLVSRYLLTITAINLCLGLVDGIILWAIGVPSAVLWGVLIAILNFVPYIGATVAIVTITFVALVTFNSVGLIILVPCVLIAVSIMEGQFITPRVVGRRLQLSPVAIFLALVVWGWIWGIAGAIMAVPFLACFKIMCEQIEGLNPIAEFLTVYSTHHKGAVTDEDSD